MPDTPGPSNGDLARRVSAVEQETAQLREQLAVTAADARAARLLAAGADHDVSEVRAELRAHTRSLNALRETQVEQGQAISELRETQIEQGAAISELRTEMRTGFATLVSGIADITTLLNHVIERDS